MEEYVETAQTTKRGISWTEFIEKHQGDHPGLDRAVFSIRWKNMHQEGGTKDTIQWRADKYKDMRNQARLFKRLGMRLKRRIASIGMLHVRVASIRI